MYLKVTIFGCCLFENGTQLAGDVIETLFKFVRLLSYIPTMMVTDSIQKNQNRAGFDTYDCNMDKIKMHRICTHISRGEHDIVK